MNVTSYLNLIFSHFLNFLSHYDLCHEPFTVATLFNFMNRTWIQVSKTKGVGEVSVNCFSRCLNGFVRKEINRKWNKLVTLRTFLENYIFFGCIYFFFLSKSGMKKGFFKCLSLDKNNFGR